MTVHRADESTLLKGRHSHVLVVGDDQDTIPALARLRPYLRGPIAQWRPAVATEPPRTTKGALIIWGVDSLDQEQQRHFLSWMDGCGADVQIISVAERPVFPLVRRQAFLEDLYYRLNMVCVPLEGDRHDPPSILA